MGLLSSLNREQKQAVGILQFGTFLEYFDLMLYIHMAVFLNELFFPKGDAKATSLLAAFALCSTMVFRPVGALIFGWIGDNIGRKATIVITTTMMALSCLIMTFLPTYAQIGIAASWLVTLSRIIQGMSSMGEITGTDIYLTETIERPAAFPCVAFTGVSASVGGMAALGIGVMVTSYNYNWRYAFAAGGFIAVIGYFARRRLRETPSFLAMKKKKMKQEVEQMNIECMEEGKGKEFNKNWKEYVNKKTLVLYFLLSCGAPLCLYLAYLYFNPLLKENFGYSSSDIIKHNFWLSIIAIASNICVASLSYYIHPLKINKVRGFLTLILMIALPFIIINSTSYFHIFLIQALILILPLMDMPATAAFLTHFPVYARFTYASLLYSLARAVIWIITSFGAVYLTGYFGVYGLWILTIPATLLFLIGTYHFIALEKRHNLYPGRNCESNEYKVA